VAGAIAGTFATGWYLISFVGVRGLVLGMGVLLLLLALEVARPVARPGLALAVLLPGLAAVGLLVANGAQKTTCTRETSYFCIRVSDTTHGGNPVRSLILDHLVHSYVKLGDPSYLGYEHEYVQELAPRGAYRLVVQDAVNDLSVPYHIMTREYNQRVRALLQPDGAYLLTVIDLFRDGQLLRAAIRTMQASFPRVQLLAAGPAWESGGANVWVIAGSTGGLDVGRMRAELGGRGWPAVLTTEMPADQLEAYVATEPRIVLTDEYAPVDNLIAILFRSRG
jgi:hypothetical protein